MDGNFGYLKSFHSFEPQFYLNDGSTGKNKAES
jgi:hypothetical protein